MGTASVALDQARIVIVDVVQFHFMSAGETVDFHRWCVCDRCWLVIFRLRLNLCDSLSLAGKTVEDTAFAGLPALGARGRRLADLPHPRAAAGQTSQIAVFSAGAATAQAGDHGRPGVDLAGGAADRTAAAMLGICAATVAVTADHYPHKARGSRPAC